MLVSRPPDSSLRVFLKASPSLDLMIKLLMVESNILLAADLKRDLTDCCEVTQRSVATY